MKSEKRNVALYLDDIIESIVLIERYLEGVTEEQFHTSQDKQDMVVRRLEIIGEAVKQMPDAFKEKYPNVPWHKIAGMRNAIIHEYFQVNFVIVWKTAKQFIPPLKKQIEEILKIVDPEINSG